MHQIWKIYPNCPAVFVDTGNELESVKQNIYNMIAAIEGAKRRRMGMVKEATLHKTCTGGHRVILKFDRGHVLVVADTKSAAIHKASAIMGYPVEELIKEVEG
jgi:hypothetical protein